LSSRPGALALVAFVISLVLTALLQFFISYTMAMLAFWMLEISTFIFILFAFEYLASGHLFPLDLLPPALRHVLFFTPFPYQMLFSHQHLHGQDCRRRSGVRAVGAGGLGAGGVRLCAVHVAARRPALQRVRGLKMRRDSRDESREQAGKEAVAGTLVPRPSSLVRYFAIYAALWKTSVTREMSFKGNFILWIVVEVLWFALQLCFISVLYLQTNSIGTWTQWQVVLLVGASSFIQQTYQAIFLSNCVNLSELVRTGKMDFLLMLPVNTRFVVSLRQVDLGSFVNGAFAVAVMVYAAGKLGLHPTVPQLLGFLALCAVGILIHYSLMFMLAAISFWTVRAQGIVWGYYNLFNIARMPDEAFRGVFKAVFTFVLPVLLVSNVPVRVLAHKLTSPTLWLVLLGMGVVCAVISEWFWRLSVRRYTSAST
jgi:ABC-2 type transport system permease protein